MSKTDGRRLLLVHAHPDDESIETGATMARYAAEGASVTLVTCTLGELGEVIPPELGYLAADAAGGLGEYRIGELAAACAALGVTDHRYLGGPGRWRDSGMMGLPSNDEAGCFWQADVQEAAAALLAIIREVRPQVMVSYDASGFYGHPDHIQAYRVAWRAFELAGGLVSKFYATALPRSVLAEAMALLPDDQAGRSAWPPARPSPGSSRWISCRSAPTTTTSRPRSTRAVTWRRSWPPCARTPPRSRWTARSSPSRTGSGSARSAPSTTPCWPGRRPGRLPEDREPDLFAGLG